MHVTPSAVFLRVRTSQQTDTDGRSCEKSRCSVLDHRPRVDGWIDRCAVAQNRQFCRLSDQGGSRAQKVALATLLLLLKPQTPMMILVRGQPRSVVATVMMPWSSLSPGLPDVEKSNITGWANQIIMFPFCTSGSPASVRSCNWCNYGVHKRDYSSSSSRGRVIMRGN